MASRTRNLGTWLDGEAPNAQRYWAGATAAGVAAVIGAAAAVVAAGVSTYAAVQSADAQEEQAKAIAKQRKEEARIAAENAAFEEGQFRRKLGILLGKQQATYAASGVSTQFGTPLFTEIDTVTQGELEARMIRAQGMQASASKIFESKVAKFQADTARASIPWIIAGGVLSAASSGMSAYTSAGGTFGTKKSTSVLGDWL